MASHIESKRSNDVPQDQKTHQITYQHSEKYAEEPHVLEGFTVDPKVERRIVRKIDFRLIPILAVLYAFSHLDRSNIGSARVDGMDADLKLTGNNSYSVALLVFFISYFIFELPSNMVLRRVGPPIWLGSLATGWGVIMLAMGFVQNAAALAGLRFVLGLFEAGFWPGVVYLSCCWYTRYEVQFRIAIYMASALVMSSFSGILSYGIGHMRGKAGFSGWRWIFIIEGSVTIVLGLLGFVLIVNFPDKAKFITEDERAIVMGRLNADRGDAEDDHITLRKVGVHLKDWKMWYLSFVYVCNTLPCYGMSYFISVILRGFGYSVGTSQLLTAPPFCAAMVIQLVTSWFSDHYKIRSPFILGHALLTVLGFGMMVGSNVNGVKYAGAIIGVVGCQPNQAFLISYLQNNIVGTSKRAVAAAMQIGGGAIGGIIASTVFRQADAPKYLPGLAVVLSMVSVMFLMLIIFAFIMYRENKKLVKGDRGPIEGMIGFKYTL